MCYQEVILFIIKIEAWKPIALLYYFKNSVPFDVLLDYFIMNQITNYFINNITKQCATRKSLLK